MYYFAHKSGLVASLLGGSGGPSFTWLTHVHPPKGCKSPASSRKTFMSSRESLLLAIPCFGLTGYGCLQSVTSFFYDRVEVPASSEPLGRINSLVSGCYVHRDHIGFQKVAKYLFCSSFFFLHPHRITTPERKRFHAQESFFF